MEVGCLCISGNKCINLDEGWILVSSTWVLLSCNVGFQLLWYDYQFILFCISLTIYSSSFHSMIIIMHWSILLVIILAWSRSPVTTPTCFWKCSRLNNLEILFSFTLICSISKSKLKNKACHLANFSSPCSKLYRWVWLVYPFFAHLKQLGIFFGSDESVFFFHIPGCFFFLIHNMIFHFHLLSIKQIFNMENIHLIVEHTHTHTHIFIFFWKIWIFYVY